MSDNPNECPEKPGYICPRLEEGLECLLEKGHQSYEDICKVRVKVDEWAPKDEGSPCPKCGTLMVAEFVDIGVGFEQAGPHVCPSCLYVQTGCPGETCAKQRCKSWRACGGRSKLWEAIEERDRRIASLEANR